MWISMWICGKVGGKNVEKFGTLWECNFNCSCRRYIAFQPFSPCFLICQFYPDFFPPPHRFVRGRMALRPVQISPSKNDLWKPYNLSYVASALCKPGVSYGNVSIFPARTTCSTPIHHPPNPLKPFPNFSPFTSPPNFFFLIFPKLL